jgi:hypothetical protein
MYWFRTNSWIDIALFLVLSAGWALGGWLLVTHAFRLRHIERILSGLAAGFLLFITISNLLAHLVSVTAALWGASLVILLAGLVAAWRSTTRPWLTINDFKAAFLLAGLVGLTILFTLILHGEAIFDEYLHLPLISIMAAGDIPPHFYLNPGFYFAYHYGLQVFAASMVRLAGFFPWSAWDISRALAIAFTLVLGWIWVRRVNHSRWAAWLGSILFTFGGGARWLLLLLPAPWLSWVSARVSLVGTGLDTAPTLAEALHRPWVIEGAGPVAFPFAFHNGIFVPVFFILGSTGAMPFMTVLLLLLLLPRGRFSVAGLTVWILLFSSLALSAEHWFALLWSGIALASILAYYFQKRQGALPSRRIYLQWAMILALTAAISLVQGGFITETARNLINTINHTLAQSYNARGFSLRWPPGLLSAHLGTLSIFSPGQLIALAAELGPALLMIPLVFMGYKKKLLRKDPFLAGLATSVAISLLLSLFFQYEVDRSTTRLPATALWTCLVLGFPVVWAAFHQIRVIGRIGLSIGFIAIILGGVVIFRTQLYSLTSAQYSYYIDGLDASYAVDYWDRLPTGTLILDRIPERSVTIFGRITLASSGIYDPLPGWQRLIDDPEPPQAALAGYDYIYIDNTWWESLNPAQQAYFQNPCVQIIDERSQDRGTDYRKLVYIRACRS